MRPIRRKRFGFAIVVVLSLVVSVTACSQPATVAPTSIGVDNLGALGIAYEDALGAPEQLALGTLLLEASDDAVTEAQAAELLPLWQALQGTTLQGETERLAMAKQIESAMTESQVAAIAAMTLTTEDEQAWLTEQGVAGSFVGGSPPVDAGNTSSGMPSDAPSGGPGAGMSEEDRASMREQLANMSEEERAEMRAQSGRTGGDAGGAVGVRGGTTSATVRAVVSLLMERSGQAAEFERPEGFAAQRPGAKGDAVEEDTAADNTAAADDAAAKDADVEADVDPTATPTPEPVADETTNDEEVTDASDEPTSTATVEPDNATVEDADAESESEVSTSADATASGSMEVDSVTVVAVATTETASAAEETAVAVASAPAAALVQVPDENPGPPFSVEISLNRAEPSSLLDEINIYTVSGLLRNDGDEVYAVNTVNFTFYDADGFRGSFYRFPNRRYGEWIDHGAMEADFDCMLLAPGEACPFIAEIAAYNMGSFYVHADAVVAEWREPVPVEVQNTSLTDQGSNVKISGMISNPNEYAIRNVVVNAVLVDANGQMTSMGSAYYVQSIGPGASVAFNALIPADSYVTYQIYAQAEGDFK